jgi:hypothetical protein
MKLTAIIASAVILISSFLSGCAASSGLKAVSGEEVALKVGQRVEIDGGKMNIQFVKVLEDSRCPRNVTCIWQGQAVCSLEITLPDGSVNNLDVIEPGLTDTFSQAAFKDYLIYFHLKPYPENATGIAEDEYRLALDAVVLKAPVNTEPDVTGFITEVEATGKNDIVGRISVESDADKLVARYVITVTRDTGLFRETGNERQSVTFNSLEYQQWVELWFAGPVMESSPMQATASQIVIIEP